MIKIITLTGDIASGKSSIAEIISKKLGWKVYTIGTIQRELAVKMDMDVNKFNLFVQEHPKIDEEIDKRIKYMEREQNIIIDSRLAWHWIPNSLKVYLKVNIEVAARRVFYDKRKTESFTSIEETKLKIIERRNFEVNRLNNKYGVNFTELNNFDLVIDTTDLDKEEVASQIFRRLKEYT
jgi:cytidylate kinase